MAISVATEALEIRMEIVDLADSFFTVFFREMIEGMLVLIVMNGSVKTSFDQINRSQESDSDRERIPVFRVRVICASRMDDVVIVEVKPVWFDNRLHLFYF